MLTMLLCLAAMLVVLIAVAHVQADQAERSRIDPTPEADPVPASELEIGEVRIVDAADAVNIREPQLRWRKLDGPFDAAPAEAAPSRADRARYLAQDLSRRLTVWTRPDGTPVHVAYCRGAPGGCETRIEALSRELVDAADAHDLDPYLLAAVAIRESGLDPAAIGPSGEGGIVQLHPQGVGAGVRYVRSAAYRARCERRPDACQAEVLEVGAAHLAEAIEGCGGVEAGLGAYNRGRCGETAYSRRVLAERERLVGGT